MLETDLATIRPHSGGAFDVYLSPDSCNFFLDVIDFYKPTMELDYAIEVDVISSQIERLLNDEGECSILFFEEIKALCSYSLVYLCKVDFSLRRMIDIAEIMNYCIDWEGEGNG